MHTRRRDRIAWLFFKKMGERAREQSGHDFLDSPFCTELKGNL